VLGISKNTNKLIKLKKKFKIQTMKKNQLNRLEYFLKKSVWVRFLKPKIKKLNQTGLIKK
jgi:hypothetical protein